MEKVSRAVGIIFLAFIATILVWVALYYSSTIEVELFKKVLIPMLFGIVIYAFIGYLLFRAGVLEDETVFDKVVLVTMIIVGVALFIVWYTAKFIISLVKQYM